MEIPHGAPGPAPRKPWPHSGAAGLGNGWSMTAAAKHSGVSRLMISQLGRGQRRPRNRRAEDLIDAYGLTRADIAAVRAIAIPLVGRDSPYKTGDWL